MVIFFNMEREENKWTLTTKSAADLIVSTLFSEESNTVEKIKNWDRVFAFLGLDCHATLQGNAFVHSVGKDKEEAHSLRKRVETEIRELDAEEAKNVILRIFAKYKEEH